ncbi:MAG: type I DNA topoisomerase [Nitrospirota bacterium]|nr:type I DNA topoisomerase [Nitrospirota bacterium]
MAKKATATKAKTKPKSKAKRSLVIVESPAKAKTIVKYLGRKYKMMASIGHLKDLPKSRFGVDIEKDFEPEYIVIKGKSKVLTAIKKAAKEADQVLLAPDPDREGEAIAWHIAEELKSINDKVYRVLFNEITKKAVKEAVLSPSEINMDRVNAQQARRVLDRIVGYKISPLLWQKVRRGLSAGRVQSVALLIICQREKEVLAFVSEEYWSIDATLSGKIPPPFVARLIQDAGQALKIHNEEEARALEARLNTAAFTVAKVEKKERKRNPTPPFITSRMQQEAARKLHFTPKKTMMLAQQLYEGITTASEGAVGLISYMRTDSVRISPEFQTESLQWISGKYGPEYVPERANVYKSKKSAQEGHEAIRPTGIEREPDLLRADLSHDQFLLYQLIWNRYVASQMRPALFDVTRVDIKAENLVLRVTGSVLKFPGFTIVYTEGKESNPNAGESLDGESALPVLSVGDVLSLESLDPKQHFTQPPARYNEALLIHDLEDKGIGRPSTYATIISTLQDREYVEKREGRFYPTDLGDTVNELLIENFPGVVNVEFTALMEQDLDEVEAGEKNWTETIRKFYDPFAKNFEKAEKEMRDVKREEQPTDIICEKCNNPLVIKWGRFGRFLACSGYPDCKNTKEFVEKEGVIKVVAKEIASDVICKVCGKGMINKTGRFGRFLACSAYPECKHTEPISLGVACPEAECKGDLTEKRSKKGKTFYACTNYPDCKFALWDRPVARPCPQCKFPILVEKYDRNKGTKVLCQDKACGFIEAPSQEPSD